GELLQVAEGEMSAVIAAVHPLFVQLTARECHLTCFGKTTKVAEMSRWGRSVDILPSNLQACGAGLRFFPTLAQFARCEQRANGPVQAGCRLHRKDEQITTIVF